MTSQNDTVTKLYEQYKTKIHGYVYSRLCNASETEDLVSEIFIKILKNIDTYDRTKASYSTWIYTITRNATYNYLRNKNRVSIDFTELCNSVDSSPLPDAILLQNENSEKLAELLETLPVRERDIIILRFYHHYTPQQVADMVGVSYTNVKVIQVRVLKKLRKILSLDT